LNVEVVGYAFKVLWEINQTAICVGVRAAKSWAIDSDKSIAKSFGMRVGKLCFEARPRESVQVEYCGMGLL
jgi:hypothetical protein